MLQNDGDAMVAPTAAAAAMNGDAMATPAHDDKRDGHAHGSGDENGSATVTPMAAATMTTTTTTRQQQRCNNNGDATTTATTRPQQRLR